MKTLLLLPGDGIGPEVIAAAEQVFTHVHKRLPLNVSLARADIGGCAIEQHGAAMPEATMQAAWRADACLLGAVGGPQWDDLPMTQRPEKALLQLRSGLQAFCNLRPIKTFAQLVSSSPLKSELVSGLDVIIVRELVGGIYFGQPRGIKEVNGERRGFNTLVYSEGEIRRTASKAFELARQRSKKLCSVDKANVLEVMQLWREVVTKMGREDYPDVSLEHMYVDNCAMQLVRQPKQFDVLVCGNMFGDILSDCGAMLTGSIGMLPSASLNARYQGVYEPVHGSAPDIAGGNKANPIAAILSLALALRYSLGSPEAADLIEQAVDASLSSGARSADIYSAEPGSELLSCTQLTDNICQFINSLDI